MRMVGSHLTSESTQSHKRCLKGNRAGKSVILSGEIMSVGCGITPWAEKHLAAVSFLGTSLRAGEY